MTWLRTSLAYPKDKNSSHRRAEYASSWDLQESSDGRKYHLLPLPALITLLPNAKGYRSCQKPAPENLSFPTLCFSLGWTGGPQQLIGGRCSKAAIPLQAGHHPILRNLLEQREEEGGICILLACPTVEHRRHIPCFSVFYPRFI